eukprot:TRINITY_DN11576_c0_g1_i1.p1 TRINITY_DN11576_c0_g1~~TRINITY_DN11576_c0_g1_i1.p1  ORF type:complete len:683 (+),score=80.73 TRINITY_DN11576_c0_g1_i1:50-2050(+)
MGCAPCRFCSEVAEDRRLLRDSRQSALALDLLPNDAAFAHPLNAVSASASDPRSAEQVAAAAAARAAPPVGVSFDVTALLPADLPQHRCLLQAPSGALEAGLPPARFVWEWPLAEKSLWTVQPQPGGQAPLSRCLISHVSRRDVVLTAHKKSQVVRPAIDRVKTLRKGGTKRIQKPAKSKDFWILEMAPAGGERKDVVEQGWDLTGGGLGTTSGLVPGWCKKRKRWELQPGSKAKAEWRVVPECFVLLLLPKRLRATEHNSSFVVPKARLIREEVTAGAETPVKEGALGNRLICFSMKLPYILGTVPQTEWTHPRTKFAALCEFAGAPLVDRTGKLGLGLKMKVLHPIPRRDPFFCKTLDQVMMERAAGLLSRSQSTGEELRVLWSGGIDTTANVVAFLRCHKEYPRARVVIQYCDRSIAEYPLFWERFLGGNPSCPFPCSKIEGHVRDAVQLPRPGEPRFVVVTGDPGDMLMGTYLMALAFRGRKVGDAYNALHYGLDKPWQEVVPRLLHARGLLDGRIEKGRMESDLPMYHSWISWITPFVHESPIPIVSTFDFLWWMTYGLKYTHDVLRVLYNRDTVSQALLDLVVNFYETNDFDQWSFSNHDLKMADHRCCERPHSCASTPLGFVQAPTKRVHLRVHRRPGVLPREAEDRVSEKLVGVRVRH